MKQILVTVMLVASFCACSKPAPPYAGALRDLAPPQVGNFKIKGEVKSIPVAPETQHQSGTLRPTENATAQYEAEGNKSVNLQLTNYPTVADAGSALKQIVDNFTSNGAKATESARGKGTGRKTSVEGIGPGYNAIIWSNSSVVYQATGKDLQAVKEFEEKFP